MARMPRIKRIDEDGWYHLCARVAGRSGWFPFEDPLARKKLLMLIKKYLGVFFCEAAGFCLMGNHYHLVSKFEAFRTLSREELYQRALKLYKNPNAVLVSDRQWERFNRRIFDVSEFMRSLQSEYAKWYNRTYDRKGAFWGDRFKSVLLGEYESIIDAVLYVELNPVRARLVERPEDWRWSSASLRAIGNDGWLTALKELIPEVDESDVESNYKYRLYYRGSVQTKAGTGFIPAKIIAAEAEKGYMRPGAFSQRIKFFTEGLVVGSEIQIKDWITKMRREMYYLRRRHPISHRLDDAIHYTLREQRASQKSNSPTGNRFSTAQG